MVKWNALPKGRTAPGRKPQTAFLRPHAARLKQLLEIAALLACVCSVMMIPALGQSIPSSASGPSSSTLQSPSSQQEAGVTEPVPSATTAPPEYRVGMGDDLGITVYNMPELDRTAVVGTKGALVLSYFQHPLDINGETTQQIGVQVAAELKRLQILLDPQVSVAVIKVESKPVVVGGSVRNPQVLQEMQPLTLQQALMLAGGPQDGAGNSVLVTRKEGAGISTSYDLSLSKVLSGTDPRFNIPVMPGDTIQVLPDQKVFVAGDVKNPGAFPIGHGQRLTVSKLMALTGGWKATAKPRNAVIVREDPNGHRKTVPLNLPKIMARKAPDVRLEANDLVYVPGSTGKAVGLGAARAAGLAAAAGLGYLIVR